MNYYFISKESWDKTLISLLQDYDIFAPVADESYQDYRYIQMNDVDRIVYNTPKPTTPLKSFFLPVKENVIRELPEKEMRIILGIPACDLAALGILDAIYLDKDYTDIYYKQKRQNTILIGTDCHSVLEHCHCTTYGIEPYPVNHHDISFSLFEQEVYLAVYSDKGKDLLKKLSVETALKEVGENEFKRVYDKRNEISTLLKEHNRHLPDYRETGNLVKNSSEDIWLKYSGTCVSCGACATICPTCTCFLLIDRPEFEKVRQLDTCQYPAFEKVAAGEDPLNKKHIRFRNRYLCKYVWKPGKFEHVACTGCGRCIEACIGSINKNELFLELTEVLA